MRRRRIGKAHPILFKYLTIFGASVGIISATAFSAMMGVDAVSGNLISNDVRTYTASFSSEGSILVKGEYKRGEELEIPENPEHSIDGENNYFFIGWDTNGNGIPDYVPKRAYYNFAAEAVYFKTGKFDLDFLDLLNMDLEDLLKLLQDLNIDWEQFMSMFNIDPETLMEWLMQQTVLSFTTNPAPSSYPTYFRSTSFGDFDYAKKSFKSPDYYDSSLISDNSVNPLSYTAYKLKKLDEAGLLPYGFGFTDYDITFNAVEDYYPVPDCESSNSMGEFVDSDAHYLKQPVGNTYHTSAAYCPAFGYIIDLFNAIPLTGAVGRDEKAYYKYALENYTAVPSEYYEVLDDMIYDPDNDWYEGEINQVDSIAAYVSSLGECSLFNEEGSIDMNSYLDSQKKSKDPVMDLITNRRGSDLDFNTTAVLLFRRLRIPARLVKGYVSIGSQAGENVISLFNQHYWCEIYVKGTGWMICDCMDTSAITGTNPYAGLDKENTPLENNHKLDRIKVKAPNKTEYFRGEPLSTTGGYITAYFTDDTSSRVSLTASGVKISGYNNQKIGPQNVTVSYTYEDITKTDKFQVNVKEQNAKLESVDWNFDYVKKEYYTDEVISTANIIATGHYDDGSIKDLSNEVKLERDQGTGSPGGPYQAVVSVTDKDVTITGLFEYTVIQDYPESITVVTPPTKLQYYVGEQLLLNGIEVAIQYKSGNVSTIQAEGYARDHDPSLFEISMTQFTVVNPHQEVEVRKWNDEIGGYVTDTFEVEVVENDLESVETYGFKQDYSVGGYFDKEEFKSGAYIVAHMKNGFRVKIAESYSWEDEMNYDAVISSEFVFDAPLLDTATTKTVNVQFEYNAVTYDAPVQITVKDYSARDYVFNENTFNCGMTAGPSGNLSNLELFNFTTSHIGTIYFRNMSFDTYSPKGWAQMKDSYYNTISANNLGYSPNSFIYNKASQIYNTENIIINYTSTVPHGVIPYYSNSTGGDYYEFDNDINAGTSNSYQFVACDITQQNVDRLSSSYIPYTDNYTSYQNSYRNKELSIYKTTNENIDAYTAVENYINSTGHQYNYNYKNNYSSPYYYNKVALINKVKEDLYNDFTYNPSFRYNRSDLDPVVSFFNQGVGGSTSFATVATLIYRHLGFAARYVTGFGANSTGGMTSVTLNNAHAWCEVYFEEAGWMIIDPTYMDTGLTKGTVGNYGAGFGGTGLYNFSKPSYTGEVSVSYDYASQFMEDPDAAIDDPARWYAVYDDKDHSHIYSIEVSPGSDELPSYLEYHIVFDWYRNDEIIGSYDSSYTYNVPTVSYGQYRLVPHVEIYDKAAGMYVTYEHNVTLAPGTEDMEFFIQPAFVYVYIYGTQESYNMDGAGYIILNTGGENADITFTTVRPQDIEDAGFFDDLPDTIKLAITGYFTYVGEGGVVVISYENVKVDPDASTYSGQYHWDEYNVITILYYGEVVINP